MNENDYISSLTPVFHTPSAFGNGSAHLNCYTDFISRTDADKEFRFGFSCIPKISLRQEDGTPHHSNYLSPPVFVPSSLSEFGTIGIDGGKLIETPLLQNFTNEENLENVSHRNRRKPQTEQSFPKSIAHSCSPKMVSKQPFDVDLDATVSKYFSSESDNVKTQNANNFENNFRPFYTTNSSSTDKTSNKIESNCNFKIDDHDPCFVKDCFSYTSDIDMNSPRNLNELYLSVCVSSGYVGAAFYDVRSTVLEVMPDLLDSRMSNIVNQLILETNPSKLVINASMKSYFTSFLSNSTFSFNNASDRIFDDSFYITLPPGDYKYNPCRKRFFNIPLPQFSKNSSSLEKDLYILSKINENDKNMIRAAGALLKFLEKKRIGVELEDAMLSVPVLDIKVTSLSDVVYVDSCSLKALQIFWELSHPSGFKVGKQKSVKEGLSIYCILNLCRSKIGSTCLKSWLLRPLKNKEILEERLDGVEYFSKSSNQELVSLLQSHLVNIGGVKTILSNLKQSVTSVGEWKTLSKTVFAAISIGDISCIRRNHLPIFKRISDVCNDQVLRVASWLNRIVDLEESHIQKRFVVKPGVDPSLDEKKRMYSRLPDILSEVAAKEMNRLRDHISECGCIYLPQIGYLLTTRCRGESPDPKMQELGFDFCFASNGLGHYKNEVTRELDRTLGDTECEIRDLESSVMNSLQESICEHTSVLLQMVDLIAHLDCLIALAASARQFDFCRPSLSNEVGIQIRKGRHPLQELCCSPFVPNDAELINEKRVALITGPSACGKSIYLKQIALIVFMAQIGSFVPAVSAKIGLVDGIFTRLKTCESVGVDLSAFVIDLNQITTAVNMASPQSLIVIDEFGVGTDKCDGPALLSSLVNCYLEKKSASPLVIVSTPISGICINALDCNAKNLSLLTFESIEDNSKHVHLFQITKGITPSSFAFEIGRSAGLPDSIFERAYEILASFSEKKGLKRITNQKSLRIESVISIVNDFMNLDLQDGDVDSFLSLLKKSTTQ